MTDPTATETVSRCLRASPFDRHLWSRLSASPSMAESIGRLAEKLPAADALLADCFVAFHRADVRWADAEASGAALAHPPILERLLASPSYARLHPDLRGQDQLSLLATDALAIALSERISPELTEFLKSEDDDARQREELADELAELEKHILERTRQRRPRPGDAPQSPELMSMTDRKARAADIDGRLESLEAARHTDYSRVRMAAGLRNEIGDMGLPAIIDRLGRDISDWGRALTVWGADPAGKGELDLESSLKLFRRLSNDAVLRAATEKLGRFRLRAAGTHRTQLPAAPLRLAGFESGNDLARLAPSELLYAAEPAAETEFLRRYAEEELLLYRTEESGDPARGPLVVAIDESSSMSGDRIEIAKPLALALIGIALADGRPAAIIRFAGPGVLAVAHFAPGQPDPATVAAELADFFGGGTDFDGPLLSALELVETDARYMKADIVIVTDGEARIHPETVARVSAARAAGGARLFAVCVGIDDRTFRDLADGTWPWADLVSEPEKLLDDLIIATHPGAAVAATA